MTTTVDPIRGFLPKHDPLLKLPPYFKPWEDVAGELPKLLANARARDAIDAMPALDAEKLRGNRQINRAMMLLSYLGHAYVWQDGKARDRLPAQLAVPWHAVATKCGRPPVLSYASYALDNWRRFDEEGPIELGNIALLQNFMAGMDEEWFILVHVEIEAEAAPAINAMKPAQQAARQDDAAGLLRQLSIIGDAMDRMNQTLNRMPEKCDPYIYYNRVRPYIHGWKDHPLIPEGVYYEGVAEYAGRPQRFRGETGAQSSIIPCVDATLTVSHAEDPLRAFLMEMRTYMPPAHVRFMEQLEKGKNVRKYVMKRGETDTPLMDAYNRCVNQLAAFRSKHLEYAANYIFKQAQQSAANPTGVGTGGTPFMPYLTKHRDESSQHLIPTHAR